MPLKSGPENKPLKVGITGGIGSGKTIVTKIFNTLGIPVYYADERAKWIVANDPVVRDGLINCFGEEAFKGGKYNREFISSQVFNNKDKLDLLNSIVHPRVGKDFEDWIQSHKNLPYVLKEAALFYEAGSYKDMDKMITVFAPEEVRIQRILQRDPQRKAEDIQKIMANQLSEEEKKQRADYIIYNDNQHLLIPQVLQLDNLFRG